MKKWLIILSFVLILSSCKNVRRDEKKEQYETYRSLYQSVLDQDEFQTSSNNFNIKANIEKKDTEYVYEVIIDDAKIAMYDVKVLVVENREAFDQVEDMMVTAGVFEDKDYHLIPNQVNIDRGFINGFQLTRSLDSPEVLLQVVVSYSDYKKLEVKREYIEFNLNYQRE